MHAQIRMVKLTEVTKNHPITPVKSSRTKIPPMSVRLTALAFLHSSEVLFPYMYLKWSHHDIGEIHTHFFKKSILAWKKNVPDIHEIKQNKTKQNKTPNRIEGDNNRQSMYICVYEINDANILKLL